VPTIPEYMKTPQAWNTYFKTTDSYRQNPTHTNLAESEQWRQIVMANFGGQEKQ
jgi:hypothetical protein